MSSMPTTTNIDYKNNLFEHSELTRVVGDPSTRTLIMLQTKIRENAQSVQSDLGESKHENLGQNYTHEEYLSLVPNAEPYNTPENPSQLSVEEGVTQY